MTGLYLVLMTAVSAVLSWGATRLVEQRAADLGLVQSPNARSSHTRPTPSGGGVGAAIVGVLACFVLALVGAPLYAALAAPLAAIAMLGFVDDMLDLPARLRLTIQVVVVTTLLIFVSPPAPISLTPEWVIGGPLLWALLLAGGLWWLNLFNFMDGIDGLAASQAILILLGAMGIWLLHDPEAAMQPSFALAILIAAATGGFLLRNWPPARIFMGDAGSNFLALSIFAIALLAVSVDGPGHASWLILVSVLASDATVTLLRRLARGEKPWVAHRRHAYQRLSRRFGHLRTTVSYGVVTLFVMTPVAWLASDLGAMAWPLATICYAVLCTLVFCLGAGSATD